MEFHDIGRVTTMKSHDADANTFRISEILRKSCSLTIKNITSLLILSLALFLALDFTYDTVEDTLSELIRYGYAGACTEGLK